MKSSAGQGSLDRARGFGREATDGSRYLDRKTSGPASHFAKSHWLRAPNMNSAAFMKLMNRFGPSVDQDFDSFLPASRKEVLGDLLSVRNDVTHGRTSNNRLDPQRYVELCEEVYDWMVTAFLADSVEVLADDGRTVVTHERG